MTTDDKEREFEEQQNHPWPGKIIPRYFDNVADAGDGYPGLQAGIRNWTKYWLSGGVMDHDLSGALNTIFTSTSGVYDYITGNTGQYDLIKLTSGVYDYMSGTRNVYEYGIGISGIYDYITGHSGQYDYISGLTGTYEHIMGIDQIWGVSGNFEYYSGLVAGNQYCPFENWETSGEVNCSVTKIYDPTAHQIVLYCAADDDTASVEIYAQYHIPSNYVAFQNSSDDITIKAKQTAGADNDAYMNVTGLDASKTIINDGGIYNQVISNASFTDYDCAIDGGSFTRGDRIIILIEVVLPDADDEVMICVPLIRLD